MSENSDTKRKKIIMINVAYALMAIAIYVVFFRYAIYIAWPFVFSFIFASILRRPTVLLITKTKMSEKLCAGIVMLLFYLIFGITVALILIKAFWSVVAWLETVPALYNREIVPFITKLFDLYTDYMGKIADESFLNSVGDVILDKLGTIVGSISNTAVVTARKMALGMPKAFIGIVFMIISSFFIAMDYSRIMRFFMVQMKPNQQQIALSTQEYLGYSIGRMFASYALIMFITFCELNIGLRILNVTSPTVLALVIAIFDILPALGTGGIVIPWIVIEAFKADFSMAFGLLIMYLIITVVRNIIEPKIVGDNLGVHPVFMLMSIYLGAYLLGPLGIIVLPFTIIVLKKLNDSGLVNIYSTHYRDSEAAKVKKTPTFDKIVASLKARLKGSGSTGVESSESTDNTENVDEND